MSTERKPIKNACECISWNWCKIKVVVIGHKCPAVLNYAIAHKLAYLRTHKKNDLGFMLMDNKYIVHIWSGEWTIVFIDFWHFSSPVSTQSSRGRRNGECQQIYFIFIICVVFVCNEIDLLNSPFDAKEKKNANFSFRCTIDNNNRKTFEWHSI